MGNLAMGAPLGAAPSSAPQPPPALPSLAHVDPVRARLVRIVMGLIMFVTGTYVGVDWAGYYHHFTSSYPARAGFARTLLCALLVWMTGRARLDATDARLLGAAFAVTVVADYCLILHDWMIPGTLLFVVVHVLLMVRHGRGFAASLLPATRARTLRLLVLTGVVALGVVGVILTRAAPILGRVHMLGVDGAYLFVVGASMWMGWGTLIRDFYGRRNAWYVAVGMTSFFCCDVSVGLAAALAGEPLGAVLNNMVGVFYSPALVLIAYSGYHWKATYEATGDAP